MSSHNFFLEYLHLNSMLDREMEAIKATHYDFQPNPYAIVIEDERQILKDNFAQAIQQLGQLKQVIGRASTSDNDNEVEAGGGTRRRRHRRRSARRTRRR